jgi:hypothetical protein
VTRPQHQPRVEEPGLAGYALTVAGDVVEIRSVAAGVALRVVSRGSEREQLAYVELPAGDLTALLSILERAALAWTRARFQRQQARMRPSTDDEPGAEP